MTAVESDSGSNEKSHRQRKATELPSEEDVDRPSMSTTQPDRLVTNAQLMNAMGIKRTGFYEAATPSMIEVVHEARYKVYWLHESLDRYMNFLRQQINSLKKANVQLSKNSNTEPTDKRFTELELQTAERKARKEQLQLDILERKAGPYDVFEKSLEVHMSAVRSILLSCSNEINATYADEAPPEMLDDIRDRLEQAINQSASLTLEDEDFAEYQDEDEEEDDGSETEEDEFNEEEFYDDDDEEEGL